MLNTIPQYLDQLPKELVVMIVGALPVSELRGAIPLALAFGMPLIKAFWLSVLGNCLIVAPALFLFKPVTSALRKFKAWARFFDWIFERTKRNSDSIQKYEALGLIIFVAIPLPMTGAWSGVIAASLFKIRFRYAFLAIVTGVVCAGLIVSSLCALGVLSWNACLPAGRG
ncbi:MAG: small multi-drug export protein [Candidatus Omnitrophica bacterium]|nr:small multi-drug export protein [Candidatus Omnitrophota bacterium]